MCQGTARSHPDCPHLKLFLIMEPCSAYQVDKCATYPTFDHNGITVHCGFCQLAVHETILREYPRFPRKCPECITEEEDKLRGVAEAMIAGWEARIQEIKAYSWMKDDKWSDILINGCEMLITQRFRSLSDDLEDLWEVSYGVGLDVPNHTPFKCAPITPPTSPEGSPSPAPPYSSVQVPSNATSENEKGCQIEGQGHSSDSNDTSFKFKRLVTTPPASPVGSPPGARPNSSVTLLSIAPPSTPVISSQPVLPKASVEIPSPVPSAMVKDVRVKGAEESHKPEDDIESSQVTVVTHKIRTEEKGHENKDDLDSSKVIVIRNEISHEDEDDPESSHVTIDHHDIQDRGENMPLPILLESKKQE